jgi:hypothetical protein
MPGVFDLRIATPSSVYTRTRGRKQLSRLGRGPPPSVKVGWIGLASRGNQSGCDAGSFVFIVHMYTYALLCLYPGGPYPSRRARDIFVSETRPRMQSENLENAATDNAPTMSRKWGSDIVSSGFTSLPNHLLSINQFVRKERRLTPTELLTLFQILSAWWHAEQLPFPSKTTIARRLGLSPRQVQRALNGLEEKGYLTRVARFYPNRGRASNSYDLSKMVALVRVLAEQNPDAFKRRRSLPAASQTEIKPQSATP